MLDDPIYHAQDYLQAELIVDHLLQNLAVQFQIEGDDYDRETMQKHVNKRAALILTRQLLLEEGERVLCAYEI